MKTLHSCTPGLLKKIKNPKIKTFITYRTGWLIQSTVGETFRISEIDNNKHETTLLYAMVKSYRFLKYQSIGRAGKNEIKRYNRNFRPWHIFQEIEFKKIKFVVSNGGLHK